jgi:hypothetical protein
MPILLPLIAFIALATSALAQVQEKSNYEAGQNFLMEWPSIPMFDGAFGFNRVDSEDIAAIDVQWFLDDTKGQPIPCKRTGIRRNVFSALILTIGNLFKCGNVTIEQDLSTWKLTDKTGAKFVLSAKGNGALRMTGMVVRIRLDGGWGDPLYLVGVPKPTKAIPAPVIR